MQLEVDPLGGDEVREAGIGEYDWRPYNDEPRELTLFIL